ncbi:MAG: PAS domain-containing protein [Spirochaetales bacterium]|nr:PAS domain-containing protein [Spirochaetales bacterium]
MPITNDIVNTIREPLIILDQKLKIVSANRSFYDFFQVSAEETEGQFIYDLGNRQWNIPRLKDLLETVLSEKKCFDNYIVEHTFDTIGHKVMFLNARQVRTKYGISKYILLVFEDITERKRIEEKNTNLFIELQKALEQIKILHGIIPICACCKKIRDDSGYWDQLEAYISKYSEAQFSHGLCPDCAVKLYPDLCKNDQ